MYTAGELVEDYTSGNVYAREILSPDGDVLCHAIETHYTRDYKPTSSTEALLSHLNRG